MGDYQRALFDFTVAIKCGLERKEPKKDRAEYYNYAGLQHFEMGQVQESLEFYTKAVDSDQKSGKPDTKSGMFLYNRAVALSRFEMLEEAIKCY